MRGSIYAIHGLCYCGRENVDVARAYNACRAIKRHLDGISNLTSLPFFYRRTDRRSGHTMSSITDALYRAIRSIFRTADPSSFRTHAFRKHEWRHSTRVYVLYIVSMSWAKPSRRFCPKRMAEARNEPSPALSDSRFPLPPVSERNARRESRADTSLRAPGAGTVKRGGNFSRGGKGDVRSSVGRSTLRSEFSPFRAYIRARRDYSRRKYRDKRDIVTARIPIAAVSRTSLPLSICLSIYACVYLCSLPSLSLPLFLFLHRAYVRPLSLCHQFRRN